MGRTQTMMIRAVIDPRDIIPRGPITEEEFLEMEELDYNFILVRHLPIKNPISIKIIHLTKIRGRDLSRTTYMENVIRPNPLPLMVR